MSQSVPKSGLRIRPGESEPLGSGHCPSGGPFRVSCCSAEASALPSPTDAQRQKVTVGRRARRLR